jgi:hypothetical protein
MGKALSDITNGNVGIIKSNLPLRPYLRVKGRQADVLLSLLDGESMTRQRTSPAIDLRRQTAVIELKRLKRDSNRHVSVH